MFLPLLWVGPDAACFRVVCMFLCMCMYASWHRHSLMAWCWLSYVTAFLFPDILFCSFCKLTVREQKGSYVTKSISSHRRMSVPGSIHAHTQRHTDNPKTCGIWSHPQQGQKHKTKWTRHIESPMLHRELKKRTKYWASNVHEMKGATTVTSTVHHILQQIVIANCLTASFYLAQIIK